MPLGRTIGPYFAQLSGARRESLLRIRACIQRIWPAVKEDMAYGTPTYHLDGAPLFILADHKHFVVFHVVPYDLLDIFKHELLMVDHGRSCIRLRKVDDKALLLLDRIVRFVGATHAESRLRSKPMLKRGRSTPLPRDPIITLDTRRTIVRSEEERAPITRNTDT